MIFDEYAEITEDEINERRECKDKQVTFGYFVPYKTALRPNKETSSVRIAFYVSSKDNGSKILNNMLLSGLNLNQNFLDAILNFRKHEITFFGEFEKAFLMTGFGLLDFKANCPQVGPSNDRNCGTRV